VLVFGTDSMAVFAPVLMRLKFRNGININYLQVLRSPRRPNQPSLTDQGVARKFLICSVWGTK
jgi:hypothetical protein